MTAAQTLPGRRGQVRWHLVSVSCAMLLTGGCPGGSLDDPDSLVTGRLLVQAETNPHLIIEQELNEGVVQPQFVTRLSDHDELAALGDVSDSTGDNIHAFEFVAVDPLTVDVVLTAEQPENAGPEVDLDVLVYDGLSLARTLSNARKRHR